MKLVDMIRNNENANIKIELIKNNFEENWNQYCPYSMFYTKNIDGNKTLYIRRDFNKYRNHNVYTFESWVRDNNKDVFDKTQDTDKKKYSKVSDIEKLLNFIKQ